VFVSDLRHFLDLPDDAPGPARAVAEQLGFVVRAATAGAVGIPWVSALPCRRRPGRRSCPGHLTVRRADDEAPIEWSCGACSDEGTISGWQDSPYDLRHAGQALSATVIAVSIGKETAATLRNLMLLDPGCERVVFQTRATDEGLVLAASEQELEELLGAVAAEGNHEANPRRQKRLDAAFALLSDAIPDPGF
jgi:hypothetical protein